MLDAHRLRAARFEVAIFVLAAIVPVVTGCGATAPQPVAKAVVLPPQPEELATVIGASQLHDLAWEFIEISAVDGSERSARRVRLSPGVHLVTARYDIMPSLMAGVLPNILVNVARFRIDGTARTLRLNVEAGVVYALYVNRDPVEYFVSRHPYDPKFSPGWDPPWEAVQCTSTAERPDELACDFPDAPVTAGENGR